jgi:hypothetical protein
VTKESHFQKNSIQFSATLCSKMENSQRPFPQIPVLQKVNPSRNCNPPNQHSPLFPTLWANIRPLHTTT